MAAPPRGTDSGLHILQMLGTEGKIRKFSQQALSCAKNCARGDHQKKESGWGKSHGTLWCGICLRAQFATGWVLLSHMQISRHFPATMWERLWVVFVIRSRFLGSFGWVGIIYIRILWFTRFYPKWFWPWVWADDSVGEICQLNWKSQSRKTLTCIRAIKHQFSHLEIAPEDKICRSTTPLSKAVSKCKWFICIALFISLCQPLHTKTNRSASGLGF